MAKALVFSLVFLVALVVAAWEVWAKWRRIREGEPLRRTDRPLKRLFNALVPSVAQTCSISKPRLLTGFMHALVAWGFFAYALGFLGHALGAWGLEIPLLSWPADIMGIPVLVGVAYLLVRRRFVQPEHLRPPERNDILVKIRFKWVNLESCLILYLISGIVITQLLWEAWSGTSAPVGSALASVLGFHPGLSEAAWWAHVLMVLGFMVWLPRTKHIHLFWGPVNRFFTNTGLEPTGVVRKLDLEDESLDHFGAVLVKHLPWKSLSDGYACVECGRCQEVCPAYLTEKPLSPRAIMENLKVAPVEGEVLKEVMTASSAWACTTCGACMGVCPVGNEHLEVIFGTRQALALEMGQVPSELNAAYKNLELYGNPWGADPSERDKALEGLNVPQYDGQEFLLWLGCAGGIDPRGRKIARALAQVLQRAGVSFGVLGSEERCTGDLARRTGNEYLFQMLAEENVNLLKSKGVKKIITLCPHCYHTLKNEYPQFGLEVEVYEHSSFILGLIKGGRLKLRKGALKLTYHDPCYLGRHNGVYESPRAILREIGSLSEMPRSRELSFCCGGGGGGFWTEEKAPRINEERSKEALETGAKVIATACPFCITMLTDGVNAQGREEVGVRDIAELVLEHLE